MRPAAALLLAPLAVLPGACERAPAPAPDDPVEARTAPAAPSAGEQGGAADWHAVASSADASRLGRLDQAWRLARAEAEEAGFAEQVEALGPLVDPNAGLVGRLQPAPGAYRCRSVRLGSSRPGDLAYVADPFFRCTIESTAGGDLILTGLSGSRRTRGLLYPDTDRRLVFVGVQVPEGDETDWPAYAQTPDRDRIGVFERIGSGRWRLVLPWPRKTAKLEIVELVP